MRESSSRKAAGANTMEIVAGAADPVSMGAGAGAIENSYSRARIVVEETSKTKRAKNTALEAIFKGC